jgi:hypothetical protein
MVGSEDRGMPGGLPVSTVHVAREIVRSNIVLQLKVWAAQLVKVVDREALRGASLSIRQMDHMVATGDGANIHSMGLEDFVEVLEYDPVRHVALVIGMRDAPSSVPVHWLMQRVFPGAEGVAVLPSHVVGEVLRLPGAPRGSFEEAMAAAEMLKGRGKQALLGPSLATLEPLGTVVVVPPGGDPAAVLSTDNDRDDG